MAGLLLQDIARSYGKVAALRDISLDVADGELVALLGPSGCGKTTLLRTIAGFAAPDLGSIHIGGRDVTRLAPGQRNTAMVFQRYALFPHMTVNGNIAFGLEMRRLPRTQRQQRIRQALELVQLPDYGDRYPHQLSGGQQQRVAIARALAVQPDVFLLDEPLSNLDARLRMDVRQEIRALQQRLGLTTVLVTHDREEAMTMADRIVIMDGGRIIQSGAPAHLYENPATPYVADFLGRINFLSGVAAQGRFTSAAGLALRTRGGVSGAIRIGIRPERIALSRVAPLTGGDTNQVQLTVGQVAFLGATLEIHATTDQGDALVCLWQNADYDTVRAIQPGTRLHGAFKPSDCMEFTQQGTRP